MRLMNKQILSPDEAQRIGLKFIQDKYFRAQVIAGEPRLVTEGTFPVYHLEGSIKIPPRGTISKLFSPAAVYTFKIQVHALDGSILSYELR